MCVTTLSTRSSPFLHDDVFAILMAFLAHNFLFTASFDPRFLFERNLLCRGLACFISSCLPHQERGSFLSLSPGPLFCLLLPTLVSLDDRLHLSVSLSFCMYSLSSVPNLPASFHFPFSSPMEPLFGRLLAPFICLRTHHYVICRLLPRLSHPSELLHNDLSPSLVALTARQWCSL